MSADGLADSLNGCEERLVKDSEGRKIFTRSWTTEESDRWLVFVHGFGEHAGRYEHVIPAFLEDRWNVLAFDFRGHGQSTGVRAHVRSFAEFSADLKTAIDSRSPAPSRLALIGHSMGGLACERTIQTGTLSPAALVLMSPLLRLRARVPRVARAVGTCVRRVWPTIRFRTTVSAEDSSRDPQVVASRREDPLLQRTITAGTFFSMEDGMSRVWTEISDNQPPTLILQAGADRVVDPSAAREWMKLNSAGKVELLELEDHFHEVFNDAEWPNTSATVRMWLDHKLPA